MKETQHDTAVLENLNPNTIIITPNRRLAVALHAEYQERQIDQGRTCWLTPTILPVNTWVDELWNAYARITLTSLPHVLNTAQEQQLWEFILSSSEWHDYFLQLSETSKLVKSARSLLKQWLVTTNHPLFDTADDYAAFKYWIHEFETTCVKHHWVDTVCLPDLVREQIKAGTITAPKHIYYFGFTDLSPQLTALMSAAETAGSTVQGIQATPIANTIVRTGANDSDEELRLCARWAKALHDQTPDLSIGVVIPLLDKKRDRVAQLFHEVFTNNDAINISAGKPLAQYPVIHAGLELLTLYKKQISCEDLFFLLSTPFIGSGETERLKRSQFDSRIRGKNFSAIHLGKQINKNEDEKKLNLARSCPLLAKRIRDFKVLHDAAPETATYAVWAQLFNQLLAALGWPGERVLNSEEYQVVDEWLKLLQDLTTLDVTAPPVKLFQALRMLSQMAGAKPFQPKSPAAKIQVLGVLEAAGLTFDHLWVSGLDDSNWPSQPKPNPFIPRKLQRDLKMPHASAERELEYCLSMTKAFASSAKQVIFSSARNQDETTLQPSPLIRTYLEVAATVIVPDPLPALSARIYEHKAMEEIQDEDAPAHHAEDKIQGGVEIIKNQAACPFKAFAECRLHARELESPLPGLRAKERGTIVHYIMEKCWGELKTRENLLEMHDETLQSMLTTIIEQALLEHAHAQSHQSGYLALEKQRLHKLASDWLTLEKERPPFVVLNSEKSAEITLGKLTFTVRIDRIDQLGDGNKLIIDYKTGAYLNANSWLGDRPDEPQLPLYAQLDDVNTAGIAFAQIAAGKHGYIGISQYDLCINGIKAAEEYRANDNKNWQALASDWKTILTQLGDDFFHGKARVDPKDAVQTCKRCSLKPLCRIQQQDRKIDDE